MSEPERLRNDAATWLARLRAPDGERDRDRFEAWRAQSPAHAAAFDRVERHWQASAVLANSPLASRPTLDRPWWRRLDFAPPRLVIGSAVAVAILLVAWSLSMPLPTTTPVHIASAVGELRSFDTPDGSRITLDSDSIVSIDFDENERRIRLDRGRARFVVARDTKRQFIVTTHEASVVAHGTIFDVDARPGEVEVALLEGAVEVRSSTANGRPETHRLAPGNRMIVKPGRARRAVIDDLPVGTASWTTGMLSFEDASLDRVVADANRYSATKLVLADPRLGSLRVTGAFRAGAPDALAESLSRMFELRAERRGATAIVLTPMPPEGG